MHYSPPFFFLERPFVHPSHPCAQMALSISMSTGSDTAHAVSINILQSPILLHLNYLLCMIRLYILSKPNPKWRIWLLVCCLGSLKAASRRGWNRPIWPALAQPWGKRQCWNDGGGLSDPATPPNWQWRSRFVSNSKACRPIGGVRLQFHVALPPHRKNVPSAMTDLSSHPRSIFQAVPKSDKHGGHSRQQILNF